MDIPIIQDAPILQFVGENNGNLRYANLILSWSTLSYEAKKVLYNDNLIQHTQFLVCPVYFGSDDEKQADFQVLVSGHVNTKNGGLGANAVERRLATVKQEMGEEVGLIPDLQETIRYPIGATNSIDRKSVYIVKIEDTHLVTSEEKDNSVINIKQNDLSNDVVEVFIVGTQEELEDKYYASTLNRLKVEDEKKEVDSVVILNVGIVRAIISSREISDQRYAMHTQRTMLNSVGGGRGGRGRGRGGRGRGGRGRGGRGGRGRGFGFDDGIIRGSLSLD